MVLAMVHLQVHSHFSLCSGTASPRQLVARAVEHGMGALALTDTDGLYGVIPFYKAAREAGVRPIIGAQVGRCVALARDREGYAQLCTLVTAIHLGTAENERPAQWPESGLDLSRLRLAVGGSEVFSDGAFRLNREKEKEVSAHLKSAELYASVPPSDGLTFRPPVSWPPHERSVLIDVELNASTVGVEVLGADRTHEYVSENADYRS